MTRRIAFLRHGHTPWNRAHRIQGRTDIPLDDDARTTLKNLTFPAPWNDAELWSSPLSRAVETARLVGRPPKISADLIEMDWGDWEGQKGLDLKADPSIDFRDIEDWGWDYCPPNGESPQDVLDRVHPWLNARETDTVAVVHMGVMRAVLAMATGWKFDGPCPFTIKRNRLYVIEKEHQKPWSLLPDPIRLTARIP